MKSRMNSIHRFSQVDQDHICFEPAGSVFKTQICAHTEMHGLGLPVDEQVTRYELTQGRKRRDHADEGKVLQCLPQFNIFPIQPSIDASHSFATNHLATERLQKSLLNAENLGHLCRKKRLIKLEEQQIRLEFHDPLTEGKT